jgi:hypothetical protein
VTETIDRPAAQDSTEVRPFRPEIAGADLAELR